MVAELIDEFEKENKKQLLETPEVISYLLFYTKVFV